MANNKDQSLFSGFPPVSTEEWEEKILENYTKEDYDKKLIWRPLDGLELRPYYRREDLDGLEYLDAYPGQFPFVRGGEASDNSWNIVDNIEVKSLERGNADAKKALEKGATALAFHFSRVNPVPVDQMAVLLSGLDLETVAVDLFTNKDHLGLLEAFSEVVMMEGLDVDKIRGSVNVAPLGHIFTTGHIGTQLDYRKLAEMIRFGAENLPRFRVLRVHGTIFHNAGCSILQQIAWSLSTAVEYLSNLTDIGLKAEEVANRIAFQFSIGPNYFLEIAALRAARLLWANILEGYGVKDDPFSIMHIHAVTSEWNQTRFDPYVNMLRGTTEAMSAVLGGADSVCVTPFDHPFSTTEEFSARHARNIQVVLKEEAYLDKVVDPAAGSYCIENLTATIVEKSWEVFLKTEEAGGILEMFRKGDLQNTVEEMADKKFQRLASRRDRMVGTNMYPDAAEKSPPEIPVIPEVEGATVPPLKKSRVAVEIEKLRLKTERSAKTPKVYILTYGNLAMRRARATFATNFFACGGFEIIDIPGSDPVEKKADAALRAEADIIVLCSSDEEYPEMAGTVMPLIRGKAVVVVAGYPKDHLEDLRSTGIEHFIHVRSNLLEELKKFQELVF